jgi:lipopolysaccharide transport system permease protein
MAKREVTDRYLGQSFGSFWVLIHPIVIMGVYVFVFAYVFKMKLGGSPEFPLDYTTYLLSGIIPWMCFQETMAKASIAVVSNASLVRQIVFPIEVLPVKTVIASFVTMIISLIILIIYVLGSNHGLQWTYMLLPFLIFFQIVAMIGISYILSAIGVYFRDIKELIQVFNVIGLYILPIFYLPDQVPRIFRPMLYCNPFSYAIWCYQDALYFGRFEHWWAWIVFPVMSIFVFSIGYRVFRKLKIMFGNVL